MLKEKSISGSMCLSDNPERTKEEIYFLRGGKVQSVKCIFLTQMWPYGIVCNLTRWIAVV